MNVCLVKTSSMDDVLHTLPALTDAQNALPDITFDWVVEENFAEIPRWHGAVKRVIPIALRRWRKQPFSTNTQQAWKRYRTLLQENQYDAVIDAQGLVKSAFFATRLAQGTKYGYNRQCAREPLASFFYDHRFYVAYQQHAVERIRQLFSLSLGYELPQTPGDYGIARHFTNHAIEKPYIVFIHATTRADKYWLEDEWKKTAEKLTALFDVEIRFPWGNEQEHQRAQRITNGLDKTTVLPKLTLTELADQIANAKAVISVDTGLAHLTAALDKPNITLYGATDPKLIGTYGKNQIYIKRESMNLIRSEEVLELFMNKTVII